jgi:hypothetical protein
MNLATAAPKCTRKSNSRMNNKLLMTWFSVVSVILVLVGAFFAFFGLGVLPVNKDVLLQWESAIYGAIMIGWGATLLYAGRLAFRRNDTELMKILLVGLAALADRRSSVLAVPRRLLQCRCGHRGSGAFQLPSNQGNSRTRTGLESSVAGFGANEYPLWVISGHHAVVRTCPVCLQ